MSASRSFSLDNGIQNTGQPQTNLANTLSVIKIRDLLTCGAVRLLAISFGSLACAASCAPGSRTEVRDRAVVSQVNQSNPPDSITQSSNNSTNLPSRTTRDTALVDDDAPVEGSALPVISYQRSESHGFKGPFSASTADDNAVELETLLENRSQPNTDSDFVIGVGDVLEISVPAIDQLKAVDVRVLGDGTITLPLLGRASAAGKTEEQVGEELREALHKYMYHPQLAVFVKEYQSREVSVMGALDRPGLYTLANSHETILSMIGKAGGLTDKAGARIFLVPAGLNGFDMNYSEPDASSVEPAIPEHKTDEGPIPPDPPQRESPARPNDAARASHSSAAVGSNNTQYLVIDLDQPNLRKYLQIPARPGDTIIVNQAGEVTVQGWVQTPGAFKITPGLTLLGAVAAAGGELFSSNARILRTADRGEQTTISANLSKIRSHEEPNIPVQAGDVVIVDRSLLGSGPYLLYTLFSKFNTGMYLPPP